MKYNVIVTLDETRNKSYYYSYITEKGNMECKELPPFQDLTKARSCYWDAQNDTWIYDAEKYAELVAKQKASEAAAEQERSEAEAVPNNAELAAALMELAENVNANQDAIAELASMIATGKGEKS